MKTAMRSAGLASLILVGLALTLAPGVWLSAAFSGEGPKEIYGFGEAKAAPSVTFNKHKGGTRTLKSFGKTSLGAIGDAKGNRITFAFGVTKDAKGNIQGRMFLRDHALKLSISSDASILVPHPKLGAPVGHKGDTFRMISSKTSVVVNGVPKPAGWRFINSPVWDGGAKDVVCFELKNPDGKKVYQWVAFLSAGNVKIK